MTGFRAFTLLLFSLHTLDIILAFDLPKASDVDKWWKDNAKKESNSESIENAKATIKRNIVQVDSNRGNELKRLTVDEPGECAMACGVLPTCHFITVEENEKSKQNDNGAFDLPEGKIYVPLPEEKKYKCGLYEENSEADEVKVKCEKDRAQEIKEWVDSNGSRFWRRVMELLG